MSVANLGKTVLFTLHINRLRNMHWCKMKALLYFFPQNAKDSRICGEKWEIELNELLNVSCKYVKKFKMTQKTRCKVRQLT